MATKQYRVDHIAAGYYIAPDCDSAKSATIYAEFIEAYFPPAYIQWLLNNREKVIGKDELDKLKEAFTIK